MSLLRKTYYHLKPYLPLQVRLQARRYIASRVHSRSGDVWPVRQCSRHKPPHWPGWPGGKKFAVVLTHDVEGRRGVSRCLDLAGLEESLGFRSSFNFIPEGEYSTPEELRRELSLRGFEIGVHDLHHDGKLYASRREFQFHAEKINKYLKDWKVCGFRSGFMHHNLDWLHDLDIAYDMSTFDTDPFEPQPDGVDTIFPFWVPAPVGNSPLRNSNLGCRTSQPGYLELPYTLPQDSTLFLLLEQKSPEVWERKLDWIAQNAGMALLNVHPDYMAFSDQDPSPAYSISIYREFLEYVRSRYSNDAWFALPREVAAYCARFRPERPSRSSKRVCMISYSFYESDNRVMRYAEALSDRGDSVDVLALNAGSLPKSESLRGVNVLRLQSRQRNEKGKFNYLFRIMRFLVHSSAVISWRQLRHRYDVVHIHNVPDFLVFAAWLPKLAGARLILDIHDILPEFFASKFGHTEKSDWYVRRLLEIERASCAFVHHVIISNHLWFHKITARSVTAGKCTAIVNHVDQQVFYPRTRTRQDDKIIAIFPGGLQWHQGLDIAIRAFQMVVKSHPTAEFHIYGDGSMKEEWQALVRELCLEKHVFFFEPLPIHQIAEKIANADLGLVPKRADSFGNEAYSTKIMEFMSQGIPVIASRTRIDTFYFNDSQIAFFESGNYRELAARMLEVLGNPSIADRLSAHGRAYVAEFNWSTRRQEYFDIVDAAEPLRLVPHEGAEDAPERRSDLVSA